MPGWNSLTMVEWSLARVTPSNATLNPSSIGNHSLIRATLELVRNSAYYQRYVVTQTILYVVIAWCSFLIDRAAPPAVRRPLSIPRLWAALDPTTAGRSRPHDCGPLSIMPRPLGYSPALRFLPCPLANAACADGISSVISSV